MRQELREYLKPGELVNQAKASFNIIKPNAEMSEDEVRRVVRRIGDSAFDTIYIGDESRLGRAGIGLMLLVTMMEFPMFYEKYDLSQRN